MNEELEDKIFKAIADKKRRMILGMLSSSSFEMNINEISKHFNESRQGITKHIKVLERAGLVDIRRDGRDSFCEPHPEKLAYVQKWMAYYEIFWKAGLDELEDFLNK